MAHALACADARRGWVHPSRIDDRHGHHVIAHRCHRRCTHRQPQDDGGHGTTIAREPGRAHHVLVRRQRRAERIDRQRCQRDERLFRIVHDARDVHVRIAAHPTAVYKCGTASNGETQVTRTFNNVTPIVVAHFAGTARPTVTVAYDSSTPPVPMSVTMRFTKPSDCTLDCTYTLFGSRRSYNPASVTTGGNPLPGDVVLLSTGAASPLWVQGSCPDPGTTIRLHRRSRQDGPSDLRRADHRVEPNTLYGSPRATPIRPLRSRARPEARPRRESFSAVSTHRTPELPRP